MNIADIRTNQLVQDGDGSLLKVSTVYLHRATAQLVYPVPQRTTVREFTEEQIGCWSEPSDNLIAQYDAAYGRD
jgi:hypothetical protein